MTIRDTYEYDLRCHREKADKYLYALPDSGKTQFHEEITCLNR